MIRISDRDHLDRTVKMIYRMARRRRGQVFFRMEACDLKVNPTGFVRVKRRHSKKPMTWAQARDLAKYGGIDNGALDLRLL